MSDQNEASRTSFLKDTTRIKEEKNTRSKSRSRTHTTKIYHRADEKSNKIYHLECKNLAETIASVKQMHDKIEGTKKKNKRWWSAREKGRR